MRPAAVASLPLELSVVDLSYRYMQIRCSAAGVKPDTQQFCLFARLSVLFPWPDLSPEEQLSWPFLVLARVFNMDHIE